MQRGKFVSFLCDSHANKFYSCKANKYTLDSHLVRVVSIVSIYLPLLHELPYLALSLSV